MMRSSGETSAHVSDMKRRALTRSRRRISLPFSPFPFSARYRRAVGFKQERSPPFGHGRCWRKRQRKLDNFDFLLLDDLGYLPQGAEEQRSSSPSSPNATNGGRWASRQTWSSQSGNASSPTPWPPRPPSTGWCITPSSWSLPCPATAPTPPSNGDSQRRSTGKNSGRQFGGNI